MRKLFPVVGLVMLSALLMVSPVKAFPPLPSSYWGTITLNGAPIQLNSQLVAYVDGVACGTAMIFYYDEEHTTGYSVNVTGDDPETPQREGGNEGDTIHFRLNGTPLAVTAVWHGAVVARADIAESSAYHSEASMRLALPFVFKQFASTAP